MKREVNASIDEPTNWKLNLFQAFESAPDSILRVGDVIWIHHSETNSIIRGIRKSKGVDKYNFSSLNLETWFAKYNLQLNIQMSASGNSFDDYSGNTFGMWIIEGKN